MATRRVHLPKFNYRTNSVEVPPTYVEFLRREAVDSDLNMYQRKYQIIEWLTMNQDREFKTTTIAGAPLLWQKDQACDAEAMGSMGSASVTIRPEKLRAFMKMCPNPETYDSMFSAMIRWQKSGRQDPALYEAIIQTIIKEDLTMLQQGLLSVGFLGQLFDYDTIGFDGNATTAEQRDFKKQANIFEGILKKVKDSPVSTMFHKDVIGNIDAGGLSGVNISGVAEALFNGAHADLQRLVYRGGMSDGRGGTVRPVLLVSSNLIGDIWTRAKTVADLQSQNSSVLREITIETGEMGYEYFWRGVPIVPIDEFCTYDKYLNSDFYFAGLTATRNIQFGTNYDSYDDVEGNRIGVTYQRIAANDIRNGDAGAIYRDTHALLACDIANAKLWSSTFKTAAK